MVGAIIVANSLVVLNAMLGLVLDLGHLYVARTELKNKEDAVVLSGPKQLDKTASGICYGTNSVVNMAEVTAAMNYYDSASKTKAVGIVADNIRFSTTSPSFNAYYAWIKYGILWLNKSG